MVCSSLPALGQEFDLQPPGEREFVSDKAHLLDDASVTRIREVCDKLLTDKGIEHVYRVTEGGHTWANWRHYLNELAAMLFQK